MSTPYNTGRVKIGSRVASPERAPDMGTEQERVQAALLAYQQRRTVKAGGHMRTPREIEEDEIAANRSRFEDTITRLAPLRRQRIAVGGGWVRSTARILRSTWRWLCSPRAW
jgi:hypothetical protein